MSDASTGREKIELDCKSLWTLAQRFSPILAFHEQERFFPALVESWLSHVTEAPWATDPAHQLGDLGPDPFHRGTALCSWQRDRLLVMAGQPVGGDRPLQLTNNANDVYAIGRDGLKTVGDNVFLDVAGWLPESRFGSGDLDRLYALFSELSAAVNQSLDWTPLHGRSDLPHAWIPQPVNPTTYCEARWAFDYHQISDQGELGDFPTGDGSLNNYLALTYHYLYPAMEPGPDGVGFRLEGQWEAATLFFRGDPAKGDQTGVAFTPPEWVVVSQGIEQASNDFHHTEARPWGEVQRLGEHPLLYVAKGTHHFYFEPVSGQTTDPGNNPNPGADPGSHDDDRDEGGITDFLIDALLLLLLGALVVALAALLSFVLAVVIAIALIVLILFLLFEWLASLFDSGDNDNSGDPVPGSQGNDEAPGDGTQAGGGEGPSGGAPPGGSGGSGSGTFGLPNTGSPTGQATVSFDVRLVDRVFSDGSKPTDFPSDTPCESPAWWDYSGCWGVKIQDGLGTGWVDGTRRVDEHRRDWGYWCGLRLSTVLYGGNPKG